jgi:hypothetical protein
MKVNLFYLGLFILVTSCATKIPLSSNYINSQSRLGLILNSKLESTGSSSGGGLGLVGALASNALQPKTKYDDALNTIGPYLNPDEKIKQLYIDAFSGKRKQIIVVDELLDAKQLKDYKVPKTSKKYFEKDLTYLKDRYQIDEVLIVTVRYGLYSRYKYGIETARYGKAYIYPEIIDLSDNSIIYKDATRALTLIRGEWKTPPAYDNLKSGISKSIEQAISTEKAKYK